MHINNISQIYHHNCKSLPKTAVNLIFSDVKGILIIIVEMTETKIFKLEKILQVFKLYKILFPSIKNFDKSISFLLTYDRHSVFLSSFLNDAKKSLFSRKMATLSMENHSTDIQQNNTFFIQSNYSDIISKYFFLKYFKRAFPNACNRRE